MAWTIPWVWLLAAPASQVTHGLCDERAKILQRARLWLHAKVPYSFDHFKDGFRTQCSGFVSFAWNLSIASPQVRG